MSLNIFLNIINVFYLLLFEHIILNFAYYYFDSLIYKGDLHFWESEFTMIALSIILFFFKIFVKRKSKIINCIGFQCLFLSFYYILYCLLCKQFVCNYSVCFFIILSIAFITLEYILFINKNFKSLFFITLLSLDVYGFIMCQTIFPVKDIPESFKFKKVDTNLRKFIIKSKFKK